MNCASELVSRAPARSETSIFDGLTHIRAWREHMGVGQPWDLAFPGCVAPLMLVPERRCRVPFRVLRPSGTWANPSNVVIPFNQSHLDGLFSCLRARKTEWDVLEFVVTLSDPGAADPIRQMLRRHGLRLIRSTDLRRPCVRIRSSWEAYYQRRRKALRGTISHRLNKMKRAGGMRVEHATGEDGLAALETFFVLHQKRWADRGQPSMYGQEHSRNFVRSFLGTLPNDTWQVSQLFLGAQVIAASVELISAHRLHKYVAAMDPEFSNFGPGKILYYCVLRDAFQKGFAEVDLGPGADGHSSYKADWATEEQIMRRFVIVHSPAVAAWLQLAPRLTKAAMLLRRARIRG